MKKHMIAAAVSAAVTLGACGQDPLVWWDFEAGANTVNKGTGGIAYNPTFNGSVSFEPGVAGLGARLPGNGRSSANNTNNIALAYALDQAGTIAFWFKPDAFFNFNSLLDNSVDPDRWEMWIQSDRRLFFTPNANQFGGYIFPEDGTNRWHHIAATWDRNAIPSEFRIYVNSVLVAAAPMAAGGLNPGTTVYFGGHTGNTGCEGVMDDIRVYTSQLTAENIRAIHDDAAPSPFKVPAIHLPLDGDAANIGYAGAAYDGVPENPPDWTTGPDGTSQAFAFAGDNHITVPYTMPHSGTLSFWMNIGPDSYNHYPIDNALGNSMYEIWVYADSSVGRVLFWTEGMPQSSADIGRNTTPAWTHITATWDIATRAVNMYINGRLWDSVTYNHAWPSAGNAFYIGGGRPGRAKAYGDIADLRVFEAPLPEASVWDLYAATGMAEGEREVAYVPFEGGYAKDVAGGHAVTVSGAAQFVDAVVGQGVAYEAPVTPGAGGTGVAIANVLGSDKGTVTMWYYARGPWYSSQPIFDNAANAALWRGRFNGQYLNIQFGPNNAYLYRNMGSGVDNWYHIAFTWDRAASVSQLYINGAYAENKPMTWSTPAPTLHLGSFHAANGAPNGIWDEVRVYNYIVPAREIAALYNSRDVFVPPPPAGTVIILK